MSVSTRATELRAALERALGEPVRMTVVDGAARLRAPAPDGGDLDAWQRLIATLSAADQWGSSDSTGTPEVWAHISEGAVMTATSTHDPTRKATALLPLPAFNELTEQQARGVMCVWDGVPLTTETAVDLGPREVQRAGSVSQWFPRGCLRCTGQHAYQALFSHASDCADGCSTDPAGCEVGRILRRLAMRGVRA